MMGARASISTENSLLIPQTAGGDDVRASLIDSALGLLAEGGRGEFSLRKVAERIGASGSAASHRFGDRAGLVAEVAAAALTREAAQLAQFADRLPSLPPSIETLAPVLTEWLDQRARWGRTQTRICCELALTIRDQNYFMHGRDAGHHLHDARIQLACFAVHALEPRDLLLVLHRRRNVDG